MLGLQAFQGFSVETVLEQRRGDVAEDGVDAQALCAVFCGGVLRDADMFSIFLFARLASVNSLYSQ